MTALVFQQLLLGGAFLAATAAFPSLTTDPAPAPNRYIGAEACKNCHSSEAQGAQFDKWEASKHSKAFVRLASPEAKKVAEAAKVTGDPQKAPECVKCHVTAFGEDPKNIKKGFKPEAGVQCETCHGPGENHYKARFAAASAAEGKADETKRTEIPAGEIVTSPPVTVCLGCHNDKTSTFKPFCFKKRSTEVRHLDPRKKRTPEELKGLECTCGDQPPGKNGECGGAKPAEKKTEKK
jgi:hypothetical protein